MDVASLIVQLARDAEMSDIKKKRKDGVVLEMVYNVLDNHSCSKIIKIYKDEGNIVIKYNHKYIRLKKLACNEIKFLEAILQNLLIEFIDDFKAHLGIENDYMIDEYDSLVFNVLHNNIRFASCTLYFSVEIPKDTISDHQYWGKELHTRTICNAFISKFKFASMLLNI